jgi:hypothetical protein
VDAAARVGGMVGTFFCSQVLLSNNTLIVVQGSVSITVGSQWSVLAALDLNDPGLGPSASVKFTI